MRPRRLRLETVALSYSLPAFRRDGFAEAELWLTRLRERGFKRVTFHPTYAVHDTEEPSIDEARAPAIVEAFAVARAMGFHITLEPHLDFVSTLTGGPYEWRRRMRVRPLRQYFDVVLAPLGAMQPDVLTLGSELDASAIEFTDEWKELLPRFAGLELAHKFNHDVDVHRVREYMRLLDRIEFSFYPPGGDFEKLGRKLFRETGAFTIGEFGLGSNDVNRPWHFDAETLRTPDNLAIRTRYYLDFFNRLAKQTYAGSATFWTAGHFDVLGVMHPEWQDPQVSAAVLQLTDGV